MLLPSLYETSALKISVILFGALVIVYLIGFQLRKILEKNRLVDSETKLDTVEGSLLALFAFFLGFTFSLSASRYDARRQVIVAEANNIGTAVLRADLYPDSTRAIMRKHFKNYIDYRLDYFNAGIDEQKIKETVSNAEKESAQIWALATKLSKEPGYSDATRLMIPALNDLIDIVTTRDATRKAKVPDSIMWVMFALSLFSAFIIGYCTTRKKMNYVTSLIFMAMITVSIYLIIDLDRPRRGIITLEGSNNRIVDLKALFKEEAK